MQQYLWFKWGVDWFEYVEWVDQGGGEDELFSSPISCVQDGLLTDVESEETVDVPS